jgi:hypothetical protein
VTGFGAEKICFGFNSQIKSFFSRKLQLWALVATIFWIDGPFYQSYDSAALEHDGRTMAGESHHRGAQNFGRKVVVRKPQIPQDYVQLPQNCVFTK